MRPIMCALIACAAAPASAAVVQVQHIGNGEGRNVKILHPGLADGSLNVFAGQLRHSITGGSGEYAFLQGDFTTFCNDFLQVVAENPADFTAVPVTMLPGAKDPQSMIAPERAQAIADIYSLHADEVLSAGVEGRRAAAFQILVWEIVADFDPDAGLSSIDIDAGAFTVTRTNGDPLGSAIRDDIAAFAAAIGSGGALADVVGIINDGAQDQLVYVPTPGAAALLGLAGLAATRRRR